MDKVVDVKVAHCGGGLWGGEKRKRFGTEILDVWRERGREGGGGGEGEKREARTRRKKAAPETVLARSERGAKGEAEELLFAGAGEIGRGLVKIVDGWPSLRISDTHTVHLKIVDHL